MESAILFESRNLAQCVNRNVFDGLLSDYPHYTKSSKEARTVAVLSTTIHPHVEHTK